MYLCFTDEAGNPEPRTNHPDDVFVLAGVIVAANRWAELDAEFEHLRKKYELTREHEIHSALIASTDLDEVQRQICGFASLSSKDRRAQVDRLWKAEIKEAAKRGENTKQLKKKQDDQDKLRPYMHLALEHRCCLLQDACDVLVELELPVIIRAVDTGTFADGRTTFVHACLGLTASFENFLRKSWLQNFLRKNWGLIVHDNCNKSRFVQVIVKLLPDAVAEKTGKPRTICPIPLFVDSNLTSMIGFADLCAYASRTSIIHGDAHLFERIWPTVHSAYHHSIKDPCDCAICSKE